MLKNLINNKYSKNFSWLLIGKIINLVIGVFVGVWVARYLGPDQYGVLSYVLAFVAFFVFLSDLGLQQVAVRELAKYPEEEEQLLGTMAMMQLIGGIMAVLCSTALISMVKPDSPVIILMVAIASTVYIFKASDIIDYYFQTHILSKFVVIARNSGMIAASILKVLFILWELPVVYFVTANVVELMVVAGLLAFLYMKNNTVHKKWVVQWSRMKKIMTYSWPLMVSNFLILIHTKVDKIMVEHYLDTVELGVYSVAVNLVEYWYFIPIIIVSTLMPFFVKLREQNTEQYNRRLLQLYSIMFWVGMAGGVGVLLFGKQVLGLLYGEAYNGAYQALVYNTWSIIFVGQGVARGIWIIAENKQAYRLYINIVAVVINIVGNIILIPIYGIAGAAIVTLSTQMLGLWVVSLFFKEIRQSTFDLLRSINPKYLFYKP